MQRFTNVLVLALVAALACGGVTPAAGASGARAGFPAAKKIVKSDAEWKKLLTDEQYYILRGQGTERAFTGKYHDHHEKGTYLCAGCRLPLFSAATYAIRGDKLHVGLLK